MNVPLHAVSYTHLDVYKRQGQHFRCAAQLRTYFRPELRPAIEGSAKEQEWVVFHLGMLGAQVALDHVGAAAHPGFVAARGLLDVHLGGGHLRGGHFLQRSTEEGGRAPAAPQSGIGLVCAREGTVAGPNGHLVLTLLAPNPPVFFHKVFILEA